MAHDFRRFSSWLFGSMHFGKASWWREHVEDAVYLMVDRKQREEIQKGARARYTLKDILLSSTRSHLLLSATSQQCHHTMNLSMD
jgi:hypothetical protein